MNRRGKNISLSRSLALSAFLLLGLVRPLCLTIRVAAVQVRANTEIVYYTVCYFTCIFYAVVKGKFLCYS